MHIVYKLFYGESNYAMRTNPMQVREGESNAREWPKKIR